MDIVTSWVSPPNQITGLDHLGIQAPCINIYAQLLPGITNVTDRARYYSFYPWLLMAMSDIGYTFNDDFIRHFRRGDVLFTLICLRHQNQCNDGNHHADAAVGSITLSKALNSLKAGDSLRLSAFAELDANTTRYFKNKLGGLGQYYLGVLRSLNLMAGNTKSGIQVTKNIGGRLADSFSLNLPTDKFLSAVSADIVSLETLDQLSEFCMCKLESNPNEQQAMIELLTGRGLFQGKDKEAESDAHIREKSLKYFLQLAHWAFDNSLVFDVGVFRALTYCQSVEETNTLHVESSLLDVIQGWASYQRNELLSVALQGLFFACLRSYEISGNKFSTIEELSNWFWSEGAGHIVLSKYSSLNDYQTLQELILSNMPSFKDWQDEGHEIQSMNQITDLSNQVNLIDLPLADIVDSSLRILAALSGREINKLGYSAGLFFPKGYFDYYPVNLVSFQRYLGWEDGEWTKLPIKECMTRMLSQWCLNAHIRVAIRKLRQQSQSTFRFMPTDDGLSIVNVPKPAHTQPRFKQTMAILKDIGLVTSDENGYLKPTEIAARVFEKNGDGS